MIGKVLRKVLGLMVALAVIVTVFAGIPLTVSAAPRNISGAITASETWNDGDIVTAVTTISGGSVGSPIVITVNGTVDVQRAITIGANSVVEFTGGGTLRRTPPATGTPNHQIINANGNPSSLTLRNITLDGNRAAVAFTVPVLVVGNANARAYIEDGTVIKNGSHLGVQAGAGILTMNGGEIKNNVRTNASGGGVHIMQGLFIMNGGIITGNHADITNVNNLEFQGGGGIVLGHANARLIMRGGEISGNTTNGVGTAILNASVRYDRVRDDFHTGPFMLLEPTSNIIIDGTIVSHPTSPHISNDFTITPQDGYPIQVTVDGNPPHATGANGVYTITGGVETGLAITVGAAGGTAPITNLAIGGVTAPATGAVPSTAAPTGGDGQWTASIAWYNNTTEALAGAEFSPGTIYRAQITVTPEAGWTLDGVTGAFTVAGATVTREGNVITAVFPITTIVAPPTGLADISAILMAMFAFFAAAVVLCSVTIRRKIRWNNR